jgi:hypothetical protein
MTTADPTSGLVELSLDEDLAVALAAYRRVASAAPGIEGDIRRILRLWLTQNGYMHEPANEGLTPDALNASNDG